MVFAAIALVLAQSIAALGAWVGARPPECGAIEGGRGANVWERAKSPELRRYCDLLASGASKLAGDPAAAREALALADQAERVLPDHAATSVLRGRALGRLGRAGEAVAELRAAKAKDGRAFDEPQILLAWARALGRSGNVLEAEEAYRKLLPRTSTLTLADRCGAAIEAGLLALRAGRARVDEAVAILRQARRDAQDVEQAFAVVALALALDRAEEEDEARAMLVERVHGDVRQLFTEARVQDHLAIAGAEAEALAMTALALEISDVAAAQKAWHAYIAAAGGAVGGTGAWVAHAREHEKQPGKARKPRP